MTEVASVLFGREDIRRRVQELGRTIAGDYVGREPVLVTVLKGGAVFLADLMRAVELPLETHFMAISRYGDAEESLGRVQILLDVDVDLTGRDVILVEDIVDTGLTLRYLLGVLAARGPGLARGLRAARQGGAPDRAASRPVRRVRVPRPVRRRLRARLPASATGTCPTSSRSTTSMRCKPTRRRSPRFSRTCERVAARSLPGWANRSVARPGTHGYAR